MTPKQCAITGAKVGLVLAFAGISWALWTGKDTWFTGGRV